MSYAIVFLNGKLVGGWPYGYNSFRLDLTPFLTSEANKLAIRLDNPTNSSRWYPGAGLYRNVWLSKESPVHVAQWGTYITTKDVSTDSATVDIVINVENKANASQQIDVDTVVYTVDLNTGDTGHRVAELSQTGLTLLSHETRRSNGSISIRNPQLWGPYPTQQQHQYVAVTRISSNNTTIDTYETYFGIRSVTFDGNKGVSVNGEHIRIQGVNQHHDLGAIGSAWNLRAATRQLEVLQELGCNAIRMSHNPPTPELLALTDTMGFLVVDEIFDIWEIEKMGSDAHLIFPDWHEADLRAFLRRDRNHPSIIAWSFGNEVLEQKTNETGAALAQSLHDIIREEDPTRPTTASMNFARPNDLFPKVLDVLSLNYQGEGVADTPAYSQIVIENRTPPLNAEYHRVFPEKVIWASESAAQLSTRGTYLFPVSDLIAAPINDTSGANSTSALVSAYELYSAVFGTTAERVFFQQDHNPFVAGEFVWAGWDYLGEPSFFSARSSYYAIIDIAGFKKDRWYLYQA